jgi:hypothetical protein
MAKKKTREKLKKMEEEKLVMRIKGMEILRKSPLDGEKIFSQEDIEIPLASIKREVEKGERTRRISLRVVRDYVNLNFKKELIEAEAKGKKVFYETSFLGRLLGFKGKKKVVRSEEVKNFVRSHIRHSRRYCRYFIGIPSSRNLFSCRLCCSRLDSAPLPKQYIEFRIKDI